MGEKRQVGYVTCEIKGISQAAWTEGGSLDSKSCWGRDGWITAEFAKVRENGFVKNQAKMMGVGLQVLTASRKDRKSSNLRQGTSLVVWGTAQVTGMNWRENLKPCCRDTGSFTAGRKRGRRTWQIWRKEPEDQGLPFIHVCLVLDLHPLECRQGLQSDSVAWLLFTAKTKKWQMNWEERAGSSGRKYSFSNDLAVLSRITAFQDRGSQQDT